MARKTKAETFETKEKILDSAEHVFYRNGVALSGLEDIAREAGMTRGAIYWHFKNKADLFQAMHERVHLPLEDLITQIARTPSPEALVRLRDLCVNAVLDLERDEQKKRIFSVLLLKCEFSGAMAETMARIMDNKDSMDETISAFFDACQKAGLVSKAIGPGIMSQMLCTFVSGLLRNYLMNPAQFTANDIEAMVTHFFRTSIGADL